MAESTAATDFTNASIAFISRHAATRDVESSEALRAIAMKKNGKKNGEADDGRGFRLLRRQHHATIGSGRNTRLCGWQYIIRHRDDDIIQAVRDAVAPQLHQQQNTNMYYDAYDKKGRDASEKKGPSNTPK
ncbi:unnamed protein product, partial [Amoebophrya sp. A25]|eukprot:GSA25T00014940001.1